jgi:hypothetical protein
MSSHEQDRAVSGVVSHMGTSERRSVRPILMRYVAQHFGLLAALLITGLIVGIAYRFLLDDVAERNLANYIRSGLHGVGIALVRPVLP